MTNRREFLRTAAALSAAPLASRAAFASERGAARLDAVVCDSRYSEALSFGARAGFFGTPVRAIEGDITDLWRGELLDRWKAGPAAIAGLTERHALFLLERLGWEHGLRVVFEAEHESVRGGVSHRIVRSADASLEAELKSAGSYWPSALADALVAGGRVATRDFRPTDAGLAAYLGETTKLYSWIIAPRSAA